VKADERVKLDRWDPGDTLGFDGDKRDGEVRVEV
jgi:hypothetical protein